jgi:hypothetical protein
VARIVESPHVLRLIAEEIDRVLSAASDDDDSRRRAIECERADAICQRDTLVAAVARGVMEDADARQTLATLRTRIDQLSQSLDRLRFRQRTTERLTAERDRMMALASDFRARAGAMSGAALRELLRPWIEGGMVDKDKRTLTLTIRRVPNAGPFLLLSPGAGRDGQQQKGRALVVRQTIPLPPPGGRARRAGG